MLIIGQTWRTETPRSGGRGILGVSLLSVCLFLSACSEALYPPRPPQMPGPALAEPSPSRMTMHVSLTASGLSKLIEATVPQNGEVPFTLLGQRKLVWR